MVVVCVCVSSQWGVWKSHVDVNTWHLPTLGLSMAHKRYENVTIAPGAMTYLNYSPAFALFIISSLLLTVSNSLIFVLGILNSDIIWSYLRRHDGNRTNKKTAQWQNVWAHFLNVSNPWHQIERTIGKVGREAKTTRNNFRRETGSDVRLMRTLQFITDDI